MPFDDEQDDLAPIIPHDSEDFEEEEDEDAPEKHGFHIEGEDELGGTPPEL